MAAQAALECTACGARNKPNWEFCARCGESLGPAKAAPPAAAAGQKAAAPAPTPTSSPLAAGWLVAGLVVAGGLSWWVYTQFSREPERLDPATFVAPTNPPSNSQPVVSRPEQEAIDAAHALLGRGDREGAIAMLRRAVDAFPRSAPVCSALAEALSGGGQPEAALELFSRAADLGGGQHRYTYGQALEAAGRTEDALEQYRRVLAENPDHAEAVDHMATLLYREARFTEAMEYIEKRVQRHPDNLVLQQSLAFAAEKSGDPARAEEVYRRVIANAPSASLTRSLLSELLIKGGRSQEALALVQEGLALAPESAMSHRSLGAVLERVGRPQEAARAYRDYLRLAPEAKDAAQLTQRIATLEQLRDGAGGEPKS